MIEFPHHRHFWCSHALLPFHPYIHSNSAYESSLPPTSSPWKTTGPSSDRTNFQLGAHCNPRFPPQQQGSLCHHFALWPSQRCAEIVSKLPSSHGNDAQCEKIQMGLTNCTWAVDNGWFPSPGGNISSGWVTGNIKWVKGKTLQAMIHIHRMHTRVQDIL